MTVSSCATSIQSYFSPGARVELQSDGVWIHEVPHFTPFMQANSYFFGHPKWGKEYLETWHRDEIFRSRWQKAIGNWDGKVVVDMGCGPGNLYATVGGKPQLMIGVDISPGALAMARQWGYTPLLADVHALPFVDGFADFVVANATIHHCDHMAQVLAESARLVRPGGMLITDMDPQCSAWNYSGLVQCLRQIRSPFYRLIGSQHYTDKAMREARHATEAHNQKPGDGIEPELYRQVLEPLGFTVELYPHNHNVGGEVFEGQYGRADRRHRLAQWLSGINPDAPEAAYSIMCVAKRALRN